MSSQTERIYNILTSVRPFAMTANEIFNHLTVKDIPKVSVNRALNELQKRGLVIKKDTLVDGDKGRKVRPWRATYKENV